MSKQSDTPGGAQLPFVSIEDPEVVRLRIAQENLEKLMALREGRIRDIESRINILCDAALSHTFTTPDGNQQNREQKERENELLTYSKELGILPPDATITKDDLGAFVGAIRAKLALWQKGELLEIHNELQQLLAQK